MKSLMLLATMTAGLTLAGPAADTAKADHRRDNCSPYGYSRSYYGGSYYQPSYGYGYSRPHYGGYGYSRGFGDYGHRGHYGHHRGYYGHRGHDHGRSNFGLYIGGRNFSFGFRR
ncbi:MAG: hypothetical protein KY476_08315 [Planctomycetes bacterium]|nr:hypothetical protein [Planctomycetota bacterium]